MNNLRRSRYPPLVPFFWVLLASARTGLASQTQIVLMPGRCAVVGLLPITGDGQPDRFLLGGTNDGNRL